ncbi:hypothetical protein E4T42_00107 [Aureobasidium subglaciale]|nr:hypothetical protein E4T38_02486 [Aureobasidium subglaciale]KAI5228054.1 hypothetical protein E4T40_02265 [Aureobasidium subglaciale]KAI5231516.1 hypothetical protein E4T41_02485 [Aureobasidium subglaciale]KAI5259286.1 hypothetical protein E4T42_00107 [Aureobasidium subglaciale]KAI5265434.1 hypothetical protein E4T46_02263 [Aureobasidium subglaciale]
MSFLLHSRPLGIGLGLGAAFTSYSLLTPRRHRYALCDASSTLNSYTSNAKVPVVNRRGGLNPSAVRQVSSGSIAVYVLMMLQGVLGGLAVSLFSKPLALLIGLLIVGVQFAESQLGISLVPYGRMQRYFTSIDLRSAMQDNVAFKLAFGATFALTGFAQL